MASTERILSVEDLFVSFNGTPVIDDLSFTLERGDNLHVIGPNGSGKTVLLRALLGTVRYSGRITWAPNVRLGYVPQKIDADRHLPINLGNLLAAKAAITGAPHKGLRGILRDVGIKPEMLRESLGHLSGGQFQKALVAFALLGKPDVLLLDEPTASIDELGEGEIYELLHRLQDAYNLTIVLVSHDLSVVFRYANQVLCLNKQNVCFGKPTDVLTPQTLAKLYGQGYKFYHHLHDADVG